jgi:hypothetical protein
MILQIYNKIMLLCDENLIIFGNNSQWKKEVKNLADCIENIFGN